MCTGTMLQRWGCTVSHRDTPVCTGLTPAGLDVQVLVKEYPRVYGANMGGLYEAFFETGIPPRVRG